MMIFAWIQGVFPFIAIGGSFCCTKKGLIINFGIDHEIDFKVDFSLKMIASLIRKAELQFVELEYLL